MASTYLEIEEVIRNAITYHHANPERPIKQVARDFGVPYSRLFARINGRIGRHERPAAGKKLTEAQEAALCGYIDQLDHKNLAIRAEHIQGAADFLLKESHSEQSSSPPTVSSNWVSRFTKRHGYHIVRQKLLDAERSMSEDPKVIGAWFEELKELINYTVSLQLMYGTWTKQVSK